MIDFVTLSNSAGQLLTSARPFIKPALAAGALGAVVYYSSSSPKDLLSLKIHKLAQKLGAFTDPNNPPRYVGRHWYTVTASVSKMDWIIQAFRWLWSVPCYLVGKNYIADARKASLEKLSLELKEAGEGIHKTYKSLDLKNGGHCVDLLSTDALIAWAALMHKDLMLDQSGSVKEYFQGHFPELPDDFQTVHDRIIQDSFLWPWLTFGEVPPFKKMVEYLDDGDSWKFKWELGAWLQHFNTSNFTPDHLEDLFRWKIQTDWALNLGRLDIKHGVDIIERQNPNLTKRVEAFRSGETITFEGKQYTLVEDIGLRSLPGVYAAWRVQSEEGPSEEERQHLRELPRPRGRVTEENINHQAILFFNNAVVGKIWAANPYREKDDHPGIRPLRPYVHKPNLRIFSDSDEGLSRTFMPYQALLVKHYPYHRISLLKEEEKIRQPNRPTFTVYS